MKYILLFLAHLDYSTDCDEIIEYSSAIEDNRMIPDDYIEEMKYLTGHHFRKFIDVQTYPDNWGCHNKEIVSFIFKERYCELSEMASDSSNYMSIRIYPSNVRSIS